VGGGAVGGVWLCVTGACIVVSPRRVAGSTPGGVRETENWVTMACRKMRAVMRRRSVDTQQTPTAFLLVSRALLADGIYDISTSKKF